MKHETTEFTEKKKKNHPKTHFTLCQIVGLGIFLLVFSLWGLPLINLGFHYIKWNSQQISEYNIEIGFIGDGFIRTEFFEPTMNRPVIYNSSENPVEQLYQQALLNVLRLCSNYTKFNVEFHYPEQVGCADFRHLQLIRVIDFELITNN